jgi:pimeloyl-ACP methyl ester carboxylesterase
MQTQNQGQNLSIPVNNFHVSYDDLGEGIIPIIFLHGYPFNKSMWQAQLEFLSPHYRIILCDIRGFGASTDEDSRLSIDLFADDLKAFMDALLIEKAVLCGLSMGGFIALNAMKRFPERFEALLLCDTMCITDTSEVKAARYATIKDIEAGSLEVFNEKFIKSVFHEDALANHKQVVANLRSMVFANTQNIITKGLVALAERSETCDNLPNITLPTLIICGRADEVTPLAESEFMAAHIPGAVLQIIDDAGHVSNLEQPEAFNQHLLNFLKTLTNLDFEKINGEKRMT